MPTDSIEPGDVKTSLRLQPETYALWNRLADHYGVKKAQVFNMALRELARSANVPIKQAEGTETE